MVTTHYRDDMVMVTSTIIQVGGRRLRTSEVELVWHRTTRPDWRVRGRTAGRGVLNILMILSGFVGAVLLIGILAAGYTESKLSAAAGSLPIPRDTLLLLAVVLLLLCLVPVVWEWALHRVDSSYDKGDAIHEIWVQVDGEESLLLRIDDVTRFGQIYRAIERAMDSHER